MPGPSNQHAQRAPCRGSGTDRARLSVPSVHELQPCLRPPSREVGRDPRRDADDPAQPVVLPADDAGLAQCDCGAAAAGLRKRIPAALPAAGLDRVVLDRCCLVEGEALDLVLGPKIEIAGVVALVQLLALVAAEFVDDPAALDGGAGVDLLRPAHHMLIFMGGQELVRARIGSSEGKTAVPGPD